MCLWTDTTSGAISCKTVLFSIISTCAFECKLWPVTHWANHLTWKVGISHFFPESMEGLGRSYKNIRFRHQEPHEPRGRKSFIFEWSHFYQTLGFVQALTDLLWSFLETFHCVFCKRFQRNALHKLVLTLYVTHKTRGLQSTNVIVILSIKTFWLRLHPFYMMPIGSASQSNEPVREKRKGNQKKGKNMLHTLHVDQFSARTYLEVG